MKPQVILISTLAEFMAEVPPAATVRLNLTERQSSQKYGGGKHTMIVPTLWIHLDLQGTNAQGEIVWLHDAHELQRTPGNGEFWTPGEKSIYEQMRKMHDLVKAYLESHGYQVRGGQYGLPQTVRPVRGVFECVRWEKDGDRFKVEPATVESEVQR
jgi:hypothetical protein